MNEGTVRSGEYGERGDYHRKLDRKWRYYPIYKAKTVFIENFLEGITKESRILDVGCGEGIIVERFRGLGYDICGLDLNYSSENVLRGDITLMPFDSCEFDVVLCLDVIEHLNFEDQKKAFGEINRVLRDGGMLLLAVPNLAHFASRVSFLLRGDLIRTSSIERHRGDRPINEYLKLLKDTGFRLDYRKGIFPTLPVISLFTYLSPGRVYWMHRVYNLLLAYPNWCFLNLLLCSKRPKEP